MDLKLNPITPEERKYTYAQSHQLSMQTGFIGHLRADMDTTGDGFYSTFFDYQPSLKSDEFKVEFDDLINSLRLEGQLLHNRATLSQHCFRNPESSYENDRSEYGFRVDNSGGGGSFGCDTLDAGAADFWKRVVPVGADQGFRHALMSHGERIRPHF